MSDLDDTRKAPSANFEQKTVFEAPELVQTLNDFDLASFLPQQLTSQVAGILSPVKASTENRLRLELPEQVIGRDRKCDLHLPDDSVSRRHALIRKTDDDQFIIEDLGSSNGTYVDGIPIVSCVLHSGDSVQLGRNLFIFDRLLEITTDKCGE